MICGFYVIYYDGHCGTIIFVLGNFMMRSPNCFAGDLLPFIFCIALYRYDASENSDIGEHVGV